MPRCEATVASEKSPNFGQQCQRDAVRGATTCQSHGGLETTTTPDAVWHNPLSMKCTAKRSDGQPCEKYAMRGGNVCDTHGGTAPQVRQAARDRLLSLVNPAISVVNEIMNDRRQSGGDRLRAANMVLNKTGFHDKTEVEVEVKPWQQMVESALLLRDGASEAEDDGDVVDAEVVDEADEQRHLDAILRQAGVDPDRTDPPPEQVRMPPPELADVSPLPRRSAPDHPSRLRQARR